jgi:hypothetical protein
MKIKTIIFKNRIDIEQYRKKNKSFSIKRRYTKLHTTLEDLRFLF